MCWRRALSRAIALAVALVALGAGQAAAVSLVPPKPDVFLGVSDRGSTQEFNEFAELTGKHPALLETFHPWGNSLNAAYERWRETGTRPVLAISTADDQTLAELITPEQIALGAGDDYLLQLNDFFAKHGLPAYIRPLGEPNRCLNAWSAVNCDGSQKGGEHTTGWYKQAFRRIVAIVRGGQTLEGINATLAGNRPAAAEPDQRAEPRTLPAAPVSIIWSPLPGGSPRVKGNFPGNYWPGSRWVDWVGTDFYSQYPVWKDLSRFYAGKQWKGKPVAITEWAVSAIDEPRFVKQLIAWIVKRPRVRMLVYYHGFGAGNHYDLHLYPRTTNTLRLKIRRANFLSSAEYNAGLLPPLPPKPKKTPEPPVDGPKTSRSWTPEARREDYWLRSARIVLASRWGSCSISHQVQWETRQPASWRRCSRRRSLRKAESVSWKRRLSASMIRCAPRQRKSGRRRPSPTSSQTFTSGRGSPARLHMRRNNRSM